MINTLITYLIKYGNVTYAGDDIEHFKNVLDKNGIHYSISKIYDGRMGIYKITRV